MAGRDITIRLSGDATGLTAALKKGSDEAGKFNGRLQDFAKQYRQTMASAFDRSAADRMATNLWGSFEGVKKKMLAQAKELKGLFSEAAIVSTQGKFGAMGAMDPMARRGTSAAVNMAAATGMDVERVGAMLAKSLGGATKELQKLIPEVGNLTKEELKAGAAIDLVAKKYEGFGDAANAAIKKAESTAKLQAAAERMKSIGQSMSLYVTAPIVAAGAASIKYASDLNESMNKVDVAFGRSAGYVKQFADSSLQRFGVGKGAALDMASTFGDMATSMGLNTEQAARMSTTLTGLAGDMSSFKNIPIAETSQALTAIFTGETESLKRMGVVMTEANLQAYALSKGISTKVQAMSESEKVMLRYQYVMDKTRNSQGDFARTANGAANAQRTVGEGLRQMAASFGQVLIPVWEKFLALVNRAIQWLSSLSTTTKAIVVAVAALAAGMGPLLMGIGVFTTTVMPALIAGGAAISTAWAPVTAVVLALAAAFAIFSINARNTQEEIDKLASTKYFKPLTLELEANEKKIKELKNKKTTGAYTSFNGVVQSDDDSSRYQIAQLERRNALIRDAIALKNRQAAAEADAKAKAEEMARVMKEQMDATTTTSERVVGLIDVQQKKVDELTQRWKSAKSEQEVAKVRVELERANAELERLKSLGLSLNRSGIPGFDTKLESPYGAGAAGTLRPTNGGGGGNVALGTYMMGSKTSYASSLKDMQALTQEWATRVRDLVGGVAVAFGEMIGNLASGQGLSSIAGFFSSFLQMVGKFCIEMGEKLILVGIGLETFKESLKNLNGWVAIAAGVALVAAGAAFVNFAKGGLGGSGGGSGSGGSGGRLLPTGNTRTAQTSTSSALATFKFSIPQRELVATIDNYNKTRALNG